MARRGMCIYAAMSVLYCLKPICNLDGAWVCSGSVREGLTARRTSHRPEGEANVTPTLTLTPGTTTPYM